ncbi:MFS transporter [Microbaculum marinisediminis]|uniref:MFS transporter n=1 Tax=Microbaculum marinisediminis TaxID=2931392 RepID=A0AAW5R0Z0_9HYPH|nr:MFS transporter [Microbaculum sp. A6E488]MCT8973042.1 MFS transporter [Microbaculum sp. A6E488]
MTSISITDQFDDGAARRNALVLAAAQAVGGASAPIVVAMSSLAGFYLLGEDKSLATLPVAFYIIGVAMGSIPAAHLMRMIGRRPGFQIGALGGLIGGATAAYAVVSGQFWLLCMGTALTGMGGSFVQQYRFAAADTASAAFRPKAISWVLAGGVITGIIGPQIVIFTKDALAPIPFAGAFLAQIVLACAVIVILGFLRIPKPIVAEAAHGGRPMRVIVSQPRFLVAVICAIASYGLMSMVMTATPLAMVACDHSQTDATLGIQWHVIAMFAPSFFTGTLIARFGHERVIAVGLLLLVGCGIVAIMGISLAHFWGALILLGVGWNFGFIGATAMLTETYEPEERTRVQGLNDFLVFGFQAVASLAAGAILNAYGWNTLNIVIFPVVALCFVALAWLWWAGDRRPTA